VNVKVVLKVNMYYDQLSVVMSVTALAGLILQVRFGLPLRLWSKVIEQPSEQTVIQASVCNLL
jgi:hypothetical protein